MTETAAQTAAQTAAEAGMIPVAMADIMAATALPGQPTLFRTDLFMPSYQPREGENWFLAVSPLNLGVGYWSDGVLVQNMAVLARKEPGGRADTWMSLSAREIESQELGCRLATGNTVVMGLGMGWAAANAALRPEVTRVTVVELDPEVIGLIGELGIFAQLPPEAAAKIAVIRDDAMTWTPDEPVDTLLADIWLPLNGDDRVAQVRQMAANTGAKRVYFWGQEMVIARRARVLGLEPLDAAGVARIVDELALPLIGPELPDYARLITVAARKWLRDAPGPA